jgi:hypothetical protein
MKTMGSPRERRVGRHEDPKTQILFDDLGGPLSGPVLSLGIWIWGSGEAIPPRGITLANGLET